MAKDRLEESERVFLQAWRTAASAELEASCLLAEAPRALLNEAIEVRQMAVQLEILALRLESRVRNLTRQMRDEQFLRDRRRQFTASEKERLFEAADGRCQTCGTELERGWHADHHIPYSRGGPTRLSNARALCSTCNLRKHDRMPEEE
jgi:5-methylcytosine-specific restriction endonuclease McrA